MTLNASVSGPVIHLDNWAIGELAEGDPSRRRRFIDAMHSGMDLLFSVTNAAEISGPQGKSADSVRAFLDEIGPRWFPARLDPTEVVKRELMGESPGSVCVDEEFLKSYVADRMRSGKVIALSDDFFRLGPIVDRMGSQRESISRSSAQCDELLRNQMRAVREMSKRDPLWLDKKFPRIPFHTSRPACFVYLNLLRIMAVEGSSVKPGDWMDFCHAVMACAFASFATLDKRWKRRVEALPKPNGLALIYSKPDLDAMVADIESWVSRN
jgi:hypothetical protein